MHLEKFLEHLDNSFAFERDEPYKEIFRYVPETHQK